MNDVVVTGFGVFTAFGYGVEALSEAVFAGKPGFSEVRRFDTSAYSASHAATFQGGGPVPTQLEALLACAREALDMACHDGADIPVLLGTNGDHAASRSFWEERHEGQQPDGTGIEDTLPARLPARLATELGLGRPRLAFNNACVASTNALVYGAELIRSGVVHGAVCGGASILTEDLFAKFDSGQALAVDEAIRPFSLGRKGLLLGDGAAVLVLESAAHAAERGAVPLGRLVGWGLSSDAHHQVQPHPRGAGLATAARRALRRAGLKQHDIGYVNAHGTGTELNDRAESLALHTVFSQRPTPPPMSSTKSMTGHLLEATGAVEAVITLLALDKGLLPPTVGFRERDPDCAVDCVEHTARAASSSYALSWNAAFGGANAALVLGGSA
ncbi:beta-ketoacyl-[acyl-carrier-protein] synthase family protein [Streptomyces sanglieri]|uniref:beta-ketoacyl-[acyl-carrier-protein] synthase family protein n=1 Tax=Streptomyces sanglieri TaxID=193460 RepID=UPI0035239E0E